MWTNNLDITKLNVWLSSRTGRVKTGNKDPFASSLRTSCRFVSALEGKAESRPEQQRSDLTSAQLYDNENNVQTRLANHFLANLKQFGIDSDDELCTNLILFLEGIKARNELYLSIVQFWYKVSKYLPMSYLSNNIDLSYFISYLSVKDKDSAYCPLNDIFSDWTPQDLDSFKIDSLSSLRISAEAQKGVDQIKKNIHEYTTRSGRQGMFLAMDIIFAFDKQFTIDKICNLNTEPERNKTIKLILQYNKRLFNLGNMIFGGLNVETMHTKGIEHYNNYLTAIRTKPFLILGGFSGTGKSQKVKELAYLTCPKELQEEKAPGNYALISVKPNWHDSTELLGYESTISKKYMVTDFMRFFVKSMHYEEQRVPFFCCMDEMNLAHVEEYFAEFLSVLESRKKDENGRIVSAPLVSANVFAQDYQNDGWNIFMDLGFALTKEMKADEVNAILDDPSRKNEAEGLFERQDLIDELKEKGLCIPSNLIVIGTVNMDDTTNSFSRKVIDRAMIFETDIERFDKDTYFGVEDALTYGNVDGEVFICDEIRADQAVGTPDFDLSEEERTEIINFINELNDAMAGTSFQVSYRVLNETILYYRAMKIVNGEKASLEQVKNDILMMKVLPRIEGDTAARKALTGLKKYVEEKNNIPEWTNIKSDMKANEIAALPATPWKDSLLKISYMLNLLNTGDGFTRFWK